MPALQQELSLATRLQTGRPLVPLEVAAWLLGWGDYQLECAIDRGDLEWCFDIRREAATRREIRVWRRSLQARARGEPSPSDWPAVAADILPIGFVPTIRAARVAEIFTCDPRHIGRLWSDGSLTGQPANGGGPDSSPIIQRASVLDFLRARRLT